MTEWVNFEKLDRSDLPSPKYETEYSVGIDFPVCLTRPIRKILPVSLTFDHRILDGAEAARFTTSLKARLEDPTLLLMED